MSAPVSYADAVARYGRVMAALAARRTIAAIARQEQVSPTRIQQLIKRGPPVRRGRPAETLR